VVRLVHSPQSTVHRESEIKISIRNLNIWYANVQAIRDISLDIEKNKVTAIIGPSGCGKSTLIRAINRMNDIIPEAKVKGEILLDGKNIYPVRNKTSTCPVAHRGKLGWHRKMFTPLEKASSAKTGLKEENRLFRRGLPRKTFGLFRGLKPLLNFLTGFTFGQKCKGISNGVYEEDVDVVEVRRKVGMVFQKSNPFPKSIFENVAYGLKINGLIKNKEELIERVEQSLKDAALWNEVKDRLSDSALDLSGGQQQRLCIARTLAVEPEVVLFDEPCSALDPTATAKIEELIQNLKKRYTIVIVTHNMQQAARISDFCAFLMLGELIEYDKTDKIFTAPSKKITEDYITGRFG